MKAKLTGVILVVLILTIFPMELRAKNIGAVAVGKLAPAVLKCFESKIVGIDVNKVYYLLTKAGDGLEKFTPSEVVYTIIVFAASFLPYKKSVTVIIFLAGLIRSMIGLTERPFSGTAFLLEKLANAIEAKC